MVRKYSRVDEYTTMYAIQAEQEYYYSLSSDILGKFSDISQEKHQPPTSTTRFSQALNFLACLLRLSQQGLQKQH